MKKPFWERGWFITLVVILGLVVIGRLVSNGSGGVNTTTTGASAASTAPAAEAGKAAAEAPAPTTEDKPAAPAPTIEDKPAASAPATEDKPDTITLKATASGDGTVMWMHDGSSNSESFNGEWTKEVPAEHGGWTVSVTGDIFGGDEIAFVGPEGGFSPREREKFKNAYALNSPYILRSNTALIATCAKLIF